MFEVQVVRQRRTSGAQGGLQALRRRFSMDVGVRSLKVFVGPPTVSIERRQSVVSIAQNRIKSVRVRGRLLRVVVDNGDNLTVRLTDQEEALRAAEVMMEIWDIDPLVEVAEALAAETTDCGVEEHVNHYTDNPVFRQLVHDMHDQIDAVLGDDGVIYAARV